MTYLIDTQILIWAVLDPRKLSYKTLEILRYNLVKITQVSLFEIAIKQKIGKLPELKIPIVELVDTLKADNFKILQLKNEHLAHYDRIPLLADHRDPFDRLILATALFENIPLISADEKFRSYRSVVHLIEN